MKRLEGMSKAELLALQEEIAARLRELEAAEAQASAPEPQEARFARSEGGPEEAKAKGSVELKMIRGHGPYAYLRYWDGGHLRSKYLGKADKVLSQGR